jgi:hypothetical protein
MGSGIASAENNTAVVPPTVASTTLDVETTDVQVEIDVATMPSQPGGYAAIAYFHDVTASNGAASIDIETGDAEFIDALEISLAEIGYALAAA